MSLARMIDIFAILILYYYVGLFSWNMLTLLLSFREIIKESWENKYKKIDNIIQESNITITIAISAFNEEKRILNCLYSVLKNNYKKVQIIVTNDGSTDNTLAVLMHTFDLYKIPPVVRQVIPTSPIRQYYQSKTIPNLLVIDKEHGPYHNPADSHNAALNTTATPVFMTLDADTILEPDALENILFSFLSKKQCISVGGAVYVVNDNVVEQGLLLTQNISKNFIVGFQCIEYIRSFTYGRAGYNPLSGALCYPGAFTLFETNALREFGGFDATNCSFDAEIILKIHHQMRKRHYPTSVHFNLSAVSWTIVPSSLRAYWRQRNFWQRGMLLSAFKHITMLFNPRYGLVGLVLLPAYFAFEIFAPVIEFISYVLLVIGLAFGYSTWGLTAWYWLLAWGGLTLLTLGSYCLNLISFSHFYKLSDLGRFVGYTTLEMFGFRQFKSACCFWATLQFIWRRIFHRFKLTRLSY